MSKLKRSVSLLALGALFGIGGLTAIALTPSRPASASPSTAPGIGIWALGGHLAGVATPGLYSTAIASTSDAATLAGLPGRSLAYFAGTDVNVNWSTGVPYSQALANGWLLTGSTGSLLTNTGYPSNYVGDVGSTGYQQAWITNVLAYLGAHPGLDGIFIDDMLYDLKPLAGTEAAKYPTQQQWAAATLSFAKAVGTALRSHGYYVALNASGYIPGDTNSNDGTNTVAWWKQLGPYTNGLMNEYYERVLRRNLQRHIPTAHHRYRLVPAVGRVAAADRDRAVDGRRLLRPHPRPRGRRAPNELRESVVPARLERRRRGISLPGQRQARPLERRLDTRHWSPSGAEAASRHSLAPQVQRRHRPRQSQPLQLAAPRSRS